MPLSVCDRTLQLLLAFSFSSYFHMHSSNKFTIAISAIMGVVNGVAQYVSSNTVPFSYHYTKIIARGVISHMPY